MSVAVPGRTAIPDPGGAATTTAGPGTAISGGVASPVFATPLSAEVDGSDEIVALLDPEHEDGLSLGTGDGVRVVLADQALSVGASGVTLDRSWRVLNVADFTAAHNTLPFTYTFTEPSAGVCRLTMTGTGAIIDGPSEGMLQLRATLKDAAGNTIDYAAGKHLLEWRVTPQSVVAGDSMIVMLGLRTKPTTADQGVPRGAGFTTGSSAVELASCAALGSTGTTAKTGLAAVCGRIGPLPITSGSFDVGTLTVTSLDSAGARIGPPPDTSTTSDSSPGTCNELHLMCGFKASHTNTRTADFILEYRLTQVIP